MRQQWLANTTAPGVAADDRRRLDFVIYGAAARGEALCCDATLVAPIRRDGSPVAGAPERDGVALATAPRRKLARYPDLARGGPHRLCVLAAEIGGHLASTPRSRHVARSSRAGLGKALVGVSCGCCPRAVCSAALGVWTMPSLPNAEGDLPIAEVLHLAAGQAPSRLPLR